MSTPFHTDLYQIWDSELEGTHPWRAQLHGYVAQFLTQAHAERYVASVKHERSRSLGIQSAQAVTKKK